MYIHDLSPVAGSTQDLTRLGHTIPPLRTTARKDGKCPAAVKRRAAAGGEDMED